MGKLEYLLETMRGWRSDQKKGIKTGDKFGGPKCCDDIEEMRTCNTQNCPSTRTI